MPPEHDSVLPWQSGRAALAVIVPVLLIPAFFIFFHAGKGGGPAAVSVTGTKAPEPGPAPLARIELAAPLHPAGEALTQALPEDQASERDPARAAELNGRALSEVQAGRLADALALLHEAAGLSSDPVIAKNLASVQARSGDLDAAAATLESIPGDPWAKGRLKEIYSRRGRDRYAKGDMSGAADYLGRAFALAPADARLAGELARAEREKEAEETMGRREGSRFLVRFEGGENAVTGHLIGLLLEEAYFKVGSDLGLWPEERIEALLYSREAFRDVTRSPSWAGAVYDGRIKLPAGGITEKTALLERVVFHEYTHAVVRAASGGRAPVWLNEGIAQHEEGRSTSGYDRALAELASKGKLSLRALEGSFMGLKDDQAQAAYLLSLSATEYIIREFGLFSIRNIFEGLGRGMDSDEAIRSALHLSYGDLERLWAGSLRDDR